MSFLAFQNFIFKLAQSSLTGNYIILLYVELPPFPLFSMSWTWSTVALLMGCHYKFVSEFRIYRPSLLVHSAGRELSNCSNVFHLYQPWPSGAYLHWGQKNRPHLWNFFCWSIRPDWPTIWYARCHWLSNQANIFIAWLIKGRLQNSLDVWS